MNAVTILQMIDHIFTSFIFIPILFILYSRFTSYKKRGRKFRSVYRICLIMSGIFFIRCFCAQFIFTEINYGRFADSGFFPLVKAIFYPNR